MEGEEPIVVKEDSIHRVGEIVEAKPAPVQIVEDKIGAVRSDDELIRIRKDKIVGYLKKNYNWIVYVALAIITFLAVKIRTRNLPGLRDITTGTWTLGPDLDPFLFLRWAKEIVLTGKLAAIDFMRYSPFGLSTSEEYLLHPYLIAWFHKVAAVFGSESVTQSAVIYPVFFFALTVVAFFLFTRKIFLEKLGERKANVIALISSFFLSVIPALLPRTIAGIPEKESVAFLFLFLALYFFLSSWKAKRNSPRYIFAILAGASTAAMANVWGGYIFIFFVIAPSVLLSFIFKKVDKGKVQAYGAWVLSSFIIMFFSSPRFSISNLFSSISTGPALAVLVILIGHSIIFNTNLRRLVESKKLTSKLTPEIFSIIAIGVVLVVLGSILFGASFVPEKLGALKDSLIKPAVSRLIQTVAENRQPYFTEWVSSFGPNFRGIQVSFWLFFVGSIYLFNQAIKSVKKFDRKVLTILYLIFLSSMVFSRYSPSSRLNGENTLSLFLYLFGALVFVIGLGYYYFKYYKSGEIGRFKEIDFGFMLLIAFSFLGVISSRAGVRFVMVLVPPLSIVISYFAVSTFSWAKSLKKGAGKIFGWIMVGLIILGLLFAASGFYNSSNSLASGYVPSAYTQQWQKAMFWVRTSTPADAVFGHWWDYGYWLQSIGERKTVLDGGNNKGYWNHLMGRHALTGTENKNALEYLYAHNTTHFLIDSTDIGKYSAFSNIGSDASYDRASFIPTLLRDQGQVQEKKNSTVFFYPSNVALDEDIIYEINGTRVFLPSGQAGLGAILIEKGPDGRIVKQPEGIFVYQGQQYVLPFRYAFQDEFLDFGSGIESGVFIFPRAIQSDGGIQIDPDGALLYLSKRTVKSQLARLYLYKEDNPNFKLVHSEDDFLVSQIKSQGQNFDLDILYFQGLRGPIRIWEIDYPSDIEFKEEYQSTVYPTEDILYAR